MFSCAINFIKGDSSNIFFLWWILIIGHFNKNFKTKSPEIKKKECHLAVFWKGGPVFWRGACFFLLKKNRFLGIAVQLGSLHSKYRRWPFFWNFLWINCGWNLRTWQISLYHLEFISDEKKSIKLSLYCSLNSELIPKLIKRIQPINQQVWFEGR